MDRPHHLDLRQWLQKVGQSVEQTEAFLSCASCIGIEPALGADLAEETFSFPSDRECPVWRVR